MASPASYKHPLNRKVKLWVSLVDLIKDQQLNERATRKIIGLALTRYNEKTGILGIVGDR